jgi:hypothetical protein
MGNAIFGEMARARPRREPLDGLYTPKVYTSISYILYGTRVKIYNSKGSTPSQSLTLKLFGERSVHTRYFTL